jgi:hypothetical protein
MNRAGCHQSETPKEAVNLGPQNQVAVSNRDFCRSRLSIRLGLTTANVHEDVEFAWHEQRKGYEVYVS